MNSPMIKAVLFDLDDTLWPIAPIIQRAELVLYEWLTQHAPKMTGHHSIESLRARRMALLPTNPRYQFDVWSLRHTILHEALLENGEDPGIADRAMVVFSEARNVVTPFDDVLPTLQRLSSKMTLGTITNGFADLEVIGLAEHFQVSVAAHKLGVGKPDPSIFLHACEKLQIAPAEAVYVGDDLQLDVEGAQKAGLRSVWMNRFARPLPEHIQPDAVCTTMNELEDWLSRQNIHYR